jgi:hypothetical protein
MTPQFAWCQEEGHYSSSISDESNLLKYFVDDNQERYQCFARYLLPLGSSASFWSQLPCRKIQQFQ